MTAEGARVKPLLKERGPLAGLTTFWLVDHTLPRMGAPHSELIFDHLKFLVSNSKFLTFLHSRESAWSIDGTCRGCCSRGLGFLCSSYTAEVDLLDQEPTVFSHMTDFDCRAAMSMWDASLRWLNSS